MLLTQSLVLKLALHFNIAVTGLLIFYDKIKMDCTWSARVIKPPSQAVSRPLSMDEHVRCFMPRVYGGKVRLRTGCSVRL